MSEGVREGVREGVAMEERHGDDRSGAAAGAARKRERPLLRFARSLLCHKLTYDVFERDLAYTSGKVRERE